jgi:hypothetical protein
MPSTPSNMKLHLRYRLWIAEMNSDINVLRIFSDYLGELAAKKNDPGVKTGIDYFEKEFIAQRKEIDALRDQMHLLKMKLASDSRKSKLLDYRTYQADNHPDLKKRYLAFRKTFETVKNKFKDFEGKLLQ